MRIPRVETLGFYEAFCPFGFGAKCPTALSTNEPGVGTARS